ncbi:MULTISPECIES: hypothetical protein [unclassified Streptomyces]|uniref:hypothetical protein n=1 Tax=unclassified Streptomyces TaxID=2593676 RepID=UPI0006FFA3A1|nr:MULTISPECIES: hypothetical protein [unclassified Streptomyces]KQX46230.1 hypothetical protein ASD33_23150 [Streptomyces sp. Root1304]KRA81015.1 hypothetical protein ASE09_16250 [Streptomyces sp. Root66D1]
MAGTDPIAEADGDDDALFVLTAALLTPARFPSVLGDDYPAACAALGLAPYEEGYGLVFGQDGLGARWTIVVDDVSLVAVAISSWDCGMAYDLSPDERSVVAGLPGWPLPVATRAPDVPAPHDPEPEEGVPAPLSPPSGAEWGPAQRRLGADEVALQWSEWRSQVNDDGTFAEPAGEPAGPTEAAGAAEAGASAEAPAAGDAVPDPYDGVRRALDELHGYLKDPPPVGRVRSDAAAGEGERTLRADGPGWSLVARTGDMAFVLLDELPREVLPVARGARLPALLVALDEMAVRPS